MNIRQPSIFARLLDYEGTRTLNSIAKAKEVYGLDIVTHRRHYIRKDTICIPHGTR